MRSSGGIDLSKMFTIYVIKNGCSKFHFTDKSLATVF